MVALLKEVLYSDSPYLNEEYLTTLGSHRVRHVIVRGLQDILKDLDAKPVPYDVS